MKPRVGFYNQRVRPRSQRGSDNSRGTFHTILSDYFKNTSVHGVRYMVEEGRHPSERILWGALCLMSVGGCYIMSKIVLDKFLTSPTMTVVESTGYSVANIPFPAITLCDVNRVNWDRAVDYQKQYLANNTQAQIDAFYKMMVAMSMSAFGDYDKIMDIFKNNTSILKTLPYINENDLMTMVRPRCTELFAELCWWRNKNVRCCEVFELQRTTTGLCYSFNSEMSEGRLPHSDLRPRRTNDHGPWSGLRVRLYLDQRKVPPAAVELITPSVTLVVENPWSLPTFGTIIPADQFAQVSIVASVTHPTHAVRSLRVDRRQCLYPDERSVPGYGQGVYTHENCILECQQAHAVKYCSCSPYFFPNRGQYRPCDVSGLLCLMEHNDVFNYQIPGYGNPYFETTDVGMNCSCPLDCKRHVYTAEIYQQPLGLLMEKERPSYEKQVFLDIHFRHNSIVRYRTEVTFDWITLTVGIGGIAGLFLGCSVLSFFELIYYVTLRWFCEWRATRSPVRALPANNVITTSRHPPTNQRLTPVAAWVDPIQSHKVNSFTLANHFTKPLQPMRY